MTLVRISDNKVKYTGLYDKDFDIIITSMGGKSCLIVSHKIYCAENVLKLRGI